MHKLRATLMAAVVVSTLMLAPVAQATDVAVLDLQKIMRDSSAAKSIREQIEKKRDQFQQEISKDEERLRKRDKELAEQRNNMAADAFEKARKDFASEVENVQREVQKKRVQLDRAYAKSLGQVQDAITEIVKEVAKEKNVQLAVPAGETLFFDPALDVTDTVMDRLNKKLTKVAVTIEPVPEAGKKSDDGKKK